MRKKNYATCQSCGEKAEYTDCSERCASPEDARCEVLRGWLSVSYQAQPRIWRGRWKLISYIMATTWESYGSISRVIVLVSFILPLRLTVKRVIISYSNRMMGNGHQPR